ncbi:MAG: WYL domain-containing protein [Bacteroidales bacterium]|nr:WYL domain-containing protein [Bacteroidales bacterium]
MASNIFGRYIWLIDILRRQKRLTFEEINSLWIDSGLSYGEGDDLPLRTFHNHRKVIKDMFDVYIECDIKSGYKYYISEPERLEGDSLRSWLIDSYATLNQIQADKKLEGRIIFENVPSGNIWLTTFTQAMRNSHVVEITHRGFGKSDEKTFEIEPYYLRIFKQRWYVVGRNPYYAWKKKKAEKEGKTYDNPIYRVYGLDRISKVTVTDKTFEMKPDFSIEDYYDGCCGIIPDTEVDKEHVVIRAYWKASDYLRTLPLHLSQKELSSDDESTLFSYDVRPTFDFYQILLAQGDQIEVVEPESVRNEMRRFAENLLSYYKK